MIASTPLILGLAALCGCPFVVPDSATLPATERVVVDTDATVETALGAGAASLADSTWAVYRSSEDAFLFRLEFGHQGQLVRLFDSFVLAQPWLGSEVILDGRAHPTAFPGGSYVFGAYTAEQGDQVGVLGIVHGLLLGTHLGTATIQFSGTFNEQRIDGTFVREVVILADTPFPPPGDTQFDVYVVRER